MGGRFRTSDETSGILKFTCNVPADCPAAQPMRMEISRVIDEAIQIRQGGDRNDCKSVRNGETSSADLSNGSRIPFNLDRLP